MKSSSDKVKEWRNNCKQRMIDAMGNKCQICGYNKCNDALELHHIDPSKKELSFSRIRANPISWDKIVEELKKCILLCSVCHKEVHNGITLLPEQYETFKDIYTVYTPMVQEVTYCPVCGEEKNYISTTCSYKCAGTLTRKVDWDSIDLHDLLIVKKMKYTQVGLMLGVSDNAVRKRFKNYIPV